MEVCLVEPCIPPNTGNIARLCAALKIPLHLIEPLGFDICDKSVKRAGLDYWPLVQVVSHPDLETFLNSYPEPNLFFFSTHAKATLWEAEFTEQALLVFGNEVAGLPDWVHRRYAGRFFRIPMLEPGVRSLNLSSAAAVAVYEAQRQLQSPDTGAWRTDRNGPSC